MSTPAKQGELRGDVLPKLLLDLLRQGFSGNLELRQGRVTKHIRWLDGLPYLADSTRASESLGALLRAAGHITAEEEERLAQKIRARQGTELEAAIELRCLPPKELLITLGEQVRACLLDAFSWCEGSFQIDSSEKVREVPDTTGVDPLALVQEGIESRWDSERTLASLAGRAEYWVKDAPSLPSALMRLRQDEGVTLLATFLDGTRTLGECLAQASTPRARAAIWVLDAMEMLRYSETPPHSEAEIGASGAAEIEILIDGAPAEAEKPEASAEEASDGSRDDGQAKSLRIEVLELVARLGQASHYEILGVPPNASPADIKRAYLQAARRFHPDVTTHLGLDEIKAESQEVFSRVTEAHSVLADPASRREYDTILAEGPLVDIERLGRAETLFRKAAVQLRAGHFRDALPLLASCVALCPEESAHHSAYGWALFKQPRPELDAARRALETAAELDPQDALSHYRLSLVYSELGNSAKASSSRIRAMRLDRAVAGG